jgi:hypothetical protein
MSPEWGLKAESEVGKDAFPDPPNLHFTDFFSFLGIFSLSPGGGITDRLNLGSRHGAD